MSAHALRTKAALKLAPWLTPPEPKREWKISTSARQEGSTIWAEAIAMKRRG
jgi:hypothetical protein